MPRPKAGHKRPGEYERRDAEFDRFRVDTLRAPERFADTIASDEETLRLGYGKDLTQVAAKSVTIMLRLSASCAGWRDPPTAAEFHDALRAPEPTVRQRAILVAFAREADWRDLIAAWAERAYTIRELVTALHRVGHANSSDSQYRVTCRTRTANSGSSCESVGAQDLDLEATIVEKYVAVGTGARRGEWQTKEAPPAVRVDDFPSDAEGTRGTDTRCCTKRLVRQSSNCMPTQSTLIAAALLSQLHRRNSRQHRCERMHLSLGTNTLRDALFVLSHQATPCPGSRSLWRALWVHYPGHEALQTADSHKCPLQA